MRHFLKIIHQFSLLANYGKIDKTCFFFKKLLTLPIRKLAKFLFIYHKSVSSFVHLTSKKVLKMALFKN